MQTKLFFAAVLLVFACTNQNKPLTDADKEKIIGEAKGVISTIYQAAESCNPEMMTSTFYNSPEFIAFINGDTSNYEETVKKYPLLMKEFKAQTPTIISENYTVIDASTVTYEGKANWECQLQNDSIAVYNNAGMELLLKKANNNWKVIRWNEVY
jgi:hypothetical protein